MKSLFGGAGLLFLGLKAAENIKAKYQQQQAQLESAPIKNHRQIAISLAHPEG